MCFRCANLPSQNFPFVVFAALGIKSRHRHTHASHSMEDSHFLPHLSLWSSTCLITFYVGWWSPRDVGIGAGSPGTVQTRKCSCLLLTVLISLRHLIGVSAYISTVKACSPGGDAARYRRLSEIRQGPLQG